MKKIVDVSVNSIHDILDIEKFLFVLKEMKNDELVDQFIESISKRITSIKKNCDDIIVESNKIQSSTGAKGIKQFDIMKGDGSIEIGLEAEDAETLKNMFKMTGEEIQILREINEYGFITKTSDPHQCENKNWSDGLFPAHPTKSMYDILHPQNTDVVLQNADIKDEEKAMEKLVGETELGEDDEMIKNDEQLVSAEDFFKPDNEDVQISKDISCDVTPEVVKDDPKLDSLLDSWKKSFIESTISTDVVTKPAKKSSKKSSKKTTKKSRK